MDRREFLLFSSGTVAAAWLFPLGGGRKNTLLERFRQGHGVVVPVDSGEGADRRIELTRSWHGNFIKAKVVNLGKKPVRIKEIVLCDAPHNLPAETHLYADTFQMLSQPARPLAIPHALS